MARPKNEDQTQSSHEPNQLDEMISAGIPCKEVVFHRTVKSLNVSAAGEPETALYDASTKAKPSRTAKLFLTPHALIYVQKHGRVIVPLANVVYSVSF